MSQFLLLFVFSDHTLKVNFLNVSNVQLQPFSVELAPAVVVFIVYFDLIRFLCLALLQNISSGLLRCIICVYSCASTRRGCLPERSRNCRTTSSLKTRCLLNDKIRLNQRACFLLLGTNTLCVLT